LSLDIIQSPEFQALLASLTPPIPPPLLAKIAVGRAKATNQSFNTWEALLSEIVVGDAFGVDRMDYLLRDSLHTGVQYGRFDHHRLLSCLRILPPAPTGEKESGAEPALGVDEGGLHAAESLLFARYFMFTQVYYHPVRLMYDAHLQDFLQASLPEHRFSTDLQQHLAMTDVEVLNAMRAASEDPHAPGHDAANRILTRRHFHLVYDRTPNDLEFALEPGKTIAAALADTFGEERVKSKRASAGSGGVEFPVRVHDGSIVSSTSLSEALRSLPKIVIDQVFVDPPLAKEVRVWLAQNKTAVLRAASVQGVE
jgi:HD superfamily phosphohydrolase